MLNVLAGDMLLYMQTGIFYFYNKTFNSSCLYMIYARCTFQQDVCIPSYAPEHTYIGVHWWQKIGHYALHTLRRSHIEHSIVHHILCKNARVRII